mgnify:CR=1 FL=1
MQDTGKFRTNSLDKYYTRESVARECVDIMLKHCSQRTWVEPSAGAGSFLIHRDEINWIAFDIAPDSKNIIKQDFLEWQPNINGECAVVGNPPFGRQSSIARKFIKKSCEFANTIGFILPLSFSKPSMQKAFPTKFHLIHQHKLESNSFIINKTTTYDVPCVFQIWVKRDRNRELEVAEIPNGFKFVKVTDDWGVSIRRVGVNAGQSQPRQDGVLPNTQSHYFVKTETYLDTNKLNAHVFPINTTGPRSLSKGEITAVVNNLLTEDAST